MKIIAIVFALCNVPALALADEPGPLPPPPTRTSATSSGTPARTECEKKLEEKAKYLSVVEANSEKYLLAAAKCLGKSPEDTKAGILGTAPKKAAPAPVAAPKPHKPYIRQWLKKGEIEQLILEMQQKCPTCKVDTEALVNMVIARLPPRTTGLAPDEKAQIETELFAALVARMPVAKNGLNGTNGKDGKARDWVFGAGYRYSNITSRHRPRATSDAVDLQLRLVGAMSELTVGGGVSLRHDRATMLYVNLDVYPSEKIRWLGISLGLQGQWYGINGNGAEAQLVGLTPGVTLRPLVTKYVDLRCTASYFIGENGFLGDRHGNVLATGFTGVCGLGGHL